MMHSGQCRDEKHILVPLNDRQMPGGEKKKVSVKDRSGSGREKVSGMGGESYESKHKWFDGLYEFILLSPNCFWPLSLHNYCLSHFSLPKLWYESSIYHEVCCRLS